MSEQKKKETNNKVSNNAKNKKPTTKKSNKTNKNGRKKDLETVISTKKNIEELETIKANEIINEELKEYGKLKKQKDEINKLNEKKNEIEDENTDNNVDENSNIESKKDESDTEDIKGINEKEKLDAINKELRADKKKSNSDENREKKHTKILNNVSIAAIFVIYFGLIIQGIINIPTIQFITDLKVFSIAELICSLILLEISYKRDSGSIFLNAIEMISLFGQTLFILELYSNEVNNINLYIAAMMSIATIYYLIKIIIIALRNVSDKDEEIDIY